MPCLEDSWTRWRDAIARACDGSHHTIESVEAEVASGRQRVLVAEGCCFVAEVADYPAARACQVLWAAGDLPSIRAALPRLETWARGEGCTEMLVEGHAGWRRVLRPQGYAPWSVTLRKPL